MANIATQWLWFTLQSMTRCPFVTKSQTNGSFRYPLKEKRSGNSKDPCRVIDCLILASKAYYIPALSVLQKNRYLKPKNEKEIKKYTR